MLMVAIYTTNIAHKIGGWYKGVRHGRGYGVHSPWAYALIMSVLREDALYYCYPQIDRLFGPRRRRDARAVFRTLVHLQPRAVTVIGNSRWDKLAALACPSAPGRQGPRVVIVDDPAKVSAEILLQLTADNGAVIFTCLDSDSGRRLWQNFVDADAGMAIDTCNRLGIVNRRADLPRQLIRARW